MTTIAYKDGVMAADSGVTAGGTFKGMTQKMYKSKKGDLVGGSGDLIILADIKNWVEALACDPKKIPEFAGEGSALWVNPAGVMHVIEQGRAVIVTAPFFAIGSGTDVATGAMAAGADAKSAVLIACQYDTSSRAPVLVADIGPDKVAEGKPLPDNVVVFKKH